jgi:hypothetical protein
MFFEIMREETYCELLTIERLLANLPGMAMERG